MRLDIGLWSCIVCSNIWSASNDSSKHFLSIIWLILAILTLVISLKSDVE